MNRFTAILAGAACAAALGTAANAADAVVEEAAVIVEPGFTWTGGYIGVNVGYGWGDFEQDFNATSPFFSIP
jgi:outer membrane immunogenic protein